MIEETKTKSKEKYVDLLTIHVKDQSKLDLNKLIFNRLDKNLVMKHLLERSTKDRYLEIDYFMNSYPFDQLRKLLINQKPIEIFNGFFDQLGKFFEAKRFHATMKELI